MIPRDNIFYFKTFAFIPEETMYNSPNSEKYKYWARTGDLIISKGSNVTDYDLIIKYIMDFSEKYGILIESVTYDAWNSTQLIINLTNLGVNCVPYSQSVGAFNRPTKDLERRVKLKSVVIDNNEVIRWAFQNVALKIDYNENIKPCKSSDNQKIDPVIAMIQAVAGYQNTPQYSYEI